MSEIGKIDELLLDAADLRETVDKLTDAVRELYGIQKDQNHLLERIADQQDKLTKAYREAVACLNQTIEARVAKLLSIR